MIPSCRCNIVKEVRKDSNDCRQPFSMALLPPLVADGEPLTLQTLTKVITSDCCCGMICAPDFQSQLVQCTREAIRASFQYRSIRLECVETVRELQRWWPIDLPIDKNWVNVSDEC